MNFLFYFYFSDNENTTDNALEASAHITTGLTMALLQILLLLLYALPAFLLPITSNPLGLEDTPDNIAWSSQLLENRSPEHEGVRKIPKSIFITPNHPEMHANCPDGYKMEDGKCIKAQNFDVNPLALITSQFQQFLDKSPTTADYDDYDYDNYDSTESAGPYHVPLSLSFDDDQPNRDNVNDGIQNMPFLADNFDHKEETSQKHTFQTSTESKSTEHEDVVRITSTAVSNVNDGADDSVANNKDSTRTEPDIKSTTPSNVVVTTPDESLLIFSEGMGASTTQKKVLDDADANLPDNAFLEKEVESILSTDMEFNPTTTTNEKALSLSKKEIAQPNAGVHHHIVHNHIELTTPSDDQNNLEKELQSESLFKDGSLTGTSIINVSDGTTEISDNDIEVTTELLNSLNDKEINKAHLISTPIKPPKVSNKTEDPIVIVPTVEQVQIVTPVQVTTTSHSTNDHREKSNSQSIPSSTSVYNSELQTAERLNINESMLNKKLRESVMKHELNEDAIETIDTNNRFVYSHIDSSSNEPEPPSTLATVQPTTQRSLLDQLRFINKFTEDSRRNNRVRFPEPSTVNIFSNFKGGTIKFPGPVQQRTSEPLFNRLIPDIIPKKPPEPTAERPLFSWLPPGTSFDFSRNSSPAFMRFWNKMPLIRDPSMASNDSPEQFARSNSKSPTDNLYKDAPASEVYKVISSKNYKHDNR